MKSLTTRGRAASDVSGLRAPERTLALLRDLVLTHTGMFYDDSRIDFLRDRLAPLVIERGFDSFLDYYYLLKYDAAAGEEWLRAIDALAVQETYFWREFDQIRALVDVVVPSLAARGRMPLRVVSLPCASGEEPLSIAMALDDAGWFARAAINIHGADASDAALARARAGRYGGRSFRQLPPAMQTKYFRCTGVDGEWAIAPEIHSRVSAWTRTNVVVPEELLRLGSCDVIFCRNLFIYFMPSTIIQVVATLAGLLPRGGILFIGAAESLLRMSTPFEMREIGGAYAYVKV